MTARTSSPTRQEKRATILVVDDSEDVRTLFHTALKADYDVKLAKNGSEALLQADSDPDPRPDSPRRADAGAQRIRSLRAAKG
jgi:response regulator RpfG family c-di-GMP phosphodiesterase